ncbi:hypothetical protein BGZ98_000311 [Dissophora globulifera]|nr:hypothetical protein BGZ98_000311 [Dissophora globulifera]
MKGARRPEAETTIGDDNLEWIDQHNRNASHKSLQNAGQTPYSTTHDYPSGDESDSTAQTRQSQFYAPDPHKRTKEYHIEQSIQAIQLLKAASKPSDWKKVLKHKSGCLVYQSTSSEDKHPTFKSEHVIRGYRARDVFSVVYVRKLWDDWYDELSRVEAYDDATSLMYMVMKSTLSSKTRDVSMVERMEIEPDGTIYFASCSVESNKIPRISGKVRADISLAGWIIQPLPSNPPITKITYVIQTDLLSRLPKFIAKRSLAKRALVITTIETHLRKNGMPMVVSNLVSPAANRHRSLSEPLKPEKFLFAEPEVEDVVQSGSAFLTPLAPIDSKKKAEKPNEFDDDSTHYTVASANGSAPTRTSRDSLASSVISGRSLAPSIFTPEFLENNARLGDTALFGDSQLFGKGGIYESTTQHRDSIAVSSSDDSLSQSPQLAHTPTHAHERSRPPLPPPSRVSPSDPSSRQKQLINDGRAQLLNQKSESRSAPVLRNVNSSTAERPTPPSVVTPATPPLTPTTSIDGKDATSDSDASSTTRAKVVLRAAKEHVPVDTTLHTRPSSMAFAVYGMRSPSDIMEARRHSTLLGRSSSFAPRHSHIIPLRGNSNAVLHSLTRMSSYNQLPNAMKRSSTAASIDSNRSSTQLSLIALPHRHSETARKALAMFKVLASSPEDRWRSVSSDGTFKSYSRVISGAGLPMLRGEGVITGGWTVEQINAVIESSGCRQVWDERFENMSIAETFNSNEYLFHVSLKGIGSLTGRDLAGVTVIDRDPQTAALYNVSTSVLDSTIPEDPGRIRALLELSGWSLRPIFDGQGNTVSVNVTYVIQIDIRGTLPNSVVKSLSASMMSAVNRLNQFMNRTGYPPYPSHISGNRLFDTFDAKTGHFELCYKAAPGWTEVRVGRKVYSEGYDFFIKPDDPTVRVELAPDFGGVRVFTTLDHEGLSIIAQVTRKGQTYGAGTKMSSSRMMQEDDDQEDNGKAERSRHDSLVPQRPRDSRVFESAIPMYGGPSPRKSSSHQKSNDQNQNAEQVDGGSSADAGDGSDLRSLGARSSINQKRRSASFSIVSVFDPNLAVASSSDRIDELAQPLSESKASQEFERSRSRSRTPRSLMSVSADAPVPLPPRRSSSLSRYSIPISVYQPQEDAPPVPNNPSSLAAFALEATTTSPDTSSLSTVRPRTPSPFASPTLGPFHIPHLPVEPAAPLSEKPAITDDDQEAVTDLDTPLSKEAATLSPLVLQSETDFSSFPLPPQPETSNTTVISTATAFSASSDTIAIALAKLEGNSNRTTTPLIRAESDTQGKDISLAFMSSPLASPLPALVKSSNTLEPVSSLKHSSSTGSNSGARRVTFSPDVVDNSENRTPVTRTRKGRKKSAPSAKVEGAPITDKVVVQEIAESTESQKERVERAVATQDESSCDSDEGDFVEAQTGLGDVPMVIIEETAEVVVAATDAVVEDAEQGVGKSASSMEMDHLRDYGEVWQTAIELFIEQLNSTQVQVTVLFAAMFIYACGPGMSDTPKRRLLRKSALQASPFGALVKPFHNNSAPTTQAATTPGKHTLDTAPAVPLPNPFLSTSSFDATSTNAPTSPQEGSPARKSARLSAIHSQSSSNSDSNNNSRNNSSPNRTTPRKIAPPSTPRSKTILKTGVWGHIAGLKKVDESVYSRYPIDKSYCSFGRSESNDVRVQIEGVSDLHCKLIRRDDGEASLGTLAAVARGINSLIFSGGRVWKEYIF